MLSVVATPIGNLGDCSERMRAALSSCDAIACEDTRVTGQLISLLGLPKKPLVALHGYSDRRKLEDVLARLRAGEHIVLVSDAGTPGISDPGYALVSAARAENIRIEAVPGPAAFLTALSASGLPVDAFTYLGFLPQKKGRKTLLQSLPDMEHTVVFYESVHRIARTLGELAEVFAHQPQRPVVVARELTKMHEEVASTTMGELAQVASRITAKGEFVVVIGPLPRRSKQMEEAE